MEEDNQKDQVNKKIRVNPRISDSDIFVKIAEELRNETEKIGKEELVKQEKPKKIEKPKPEPKVQLAKKLEPKLEPIKKLEPIRKPELKPIPRIEPKHKEIMKSIRKKPTGYHLDLQNIFSKIKEHQIERKEKQRQEEIKNQRRREIEQLEKKQRAEERAKQEEDRKRLIEKSRELRKIKEEQPEKLSPDLSRLFKRTPETIEKPEITVELDIERNIDDSESESTGELIKKPIKKLPSNDRDRDIDIQNIINEVKNEKQEKEEESKEESKQENEEENEEESKKYEVINLPEVITESRIPRKKKIREPSDAFIGIELASLKKDLEDKKKHRGKYKELKKSKEEESLNQRYNFKDEEPKSLLPDISSGSKKLDFKVDDLAYFSPKLPESTIEPIAKPVAKPIVKPTFKPNVEKNVKKTNTLASINQESRREAEKMGQSIDAELMGQLIDAKEITRVIEIKGQERKQDKKILVKPIEKIKKTTNELKIPKTKYFEKQRFEDISKNLHEISRIISKDKQEFGFSFNQAQDFQEKTEEKLDFLNEKIRNNINIIKQDFSVVPDDNSRI